MRVLVALDGSEPGELAVRAIAPLAREAGMDVVLLTVLDPGHIHETLAGPDHVPRVPLAATPAGQYVRGATPAPPKPAEDRSQALERARVEAQEYLESQAAQHLQDVICEARVEWSANAAEAISRHAKECGADLIAVGTHGRSGPGHALMGSVAEEVVRRAPVPVLVVRPGMNLPEAEDTEPRGWWHLGRHEAPAND